MLAKSPGISAVAVTLFLLFGVALIWIVARFVRTNRNDTLTSGPLTPEQELVIAEPGEVVLLVEGPRFSSAYVGFEFELVEKQSGQTNRMKYHVLKDQGAVYGVSTMQVPYGRITVSHPGAYVVRTRGLEPGKNYSDFRLLLSRPFVGRMAVQIVGIALCGAGMLLSVIWGTWKLGLMQPPPPPPAAAVTPPSGGVPGHTIDLETWRRQQAQPPPKK